MNQPAVEVDHSRRRSEAVQEMLIRVRWTHAVTLTFNHHATSLSRARKCLRDWDARLCRLLLGARWQRKPDERLLWFAFLEGHDYNPHWHLLVEALPPQFELLEENVERTWTRLVASGSTDVRVVDSRQGAIRYATKMLRNPACYANFCHSIEFIRA